MNSQKVNEIINQNIRNKNRANIQREHVNAQGYRVDNNGNIDIVLGRSFCFPMAETHWDKFLVDENNNLIKYDSNY